MKTASIEYQILLATSEIHPDNGQGKMLLRLITDEFDQDRLVEMAVREGVAGLLYKNLKNAGVLGYLGHRQIEKLQSFYYAAVRLNLRLLYDLKEILQELNPSKIRVVLLQGIPLLQQIYKDVGLRPLTDIDLWLLPQNFAALEKTLMKLGYRKDPLYPKTFKRNSTLIDVNTHFLWAERIESRRFLIDADQEDIYQNCRIIDVEREPAGCLSRLDQIIYLSLHAFKHNLDRLIWLVDIKNLIKEWNAADWLALHRRSRDLGVEHIFHYILFYLDQLFELRLPAEIQVLNEDGKPGYLENRILQKRLYAKPLPGWGALLLLSLHKGFYKKIVFIFENLFPRPPVLRQIFNKASDFTDWQLYLKRALQLFGMVKN